MVTDIKMLLMCQTDTQNHSWWQGLKISVYFWDIVDGLFYNLNALHIIIITESRFFHSGQEECVYSMFFFVLKFL